MSLRKAPIVLTNRGGLDPPLYDHAKDTYRPMAVISSKVRGRRQLTSFVSCKAWLQDLYAFHFAGVTLPDSIWAGPSPSLNPDTDRIRIAVAMPDSAWVGAKKLVNAYEEDCNWPLTAVYDGCLFPEAKETTGTLPPPKKVMHGVGWQLVWFVGSKRWLATPHLCAMYLLLLRVGSCNKFPEEPCTVEELIPIYENILNKGGRWHGSDKTYLRDTFDLMHLVPRHYEEAYATRIAKGIDDVWRSSTHSDGIQYMCCGIRYKLDKLGAMYTGYAKEAGIFADIIRRDYPDMEVRDRHTDSAIRW